MADQFPKTPPLFSTALAADYAPTDPSFIIASDIISYNEALTGVPGPALSGLVCASIDIGSPIPQYDIGILVGNVFTVAIRNCNPLDPEVAGDPPIQTHRRGALVEITDFASIQMMRNVLNGNKPLQNVLKCLANAVNPQDIPNYGQLVAAVIAAGIPATNLTLGIVRLSQSAASVIGNPTISIGTPCIVTIANTLIEGDVVQFTTTGALPTGISVGANYYVISAGLSGTQFEFSATPGGTAVNTSGIQSGTHTVTRVTPVVQNELPAGQVAALAGTSGTPGPSNKYVTNADTAGTGPIVRTSLLPSVIGTKASFLAGANLTAGQALHLSPYAQIDGGIGFDTQDSQAYNNATNQTKSFTVAVQLNRVLLVGVVATAAPSSVAYNAVPMTLIDSQALFGGYVLYAYRLIAPATGANNILVTGTGIYEIAGASYYNVNQVSPIQASSKNTASGATIVGSLALGAQGTFAHLFYGHYVSGGAIGATVTYGTKYVNTVNGTNVFSAQTPVSLTTSSLNKFNESQTISATMVETSPSGSNETSSFIMISLAPFTVPVMGVVPTDTSAIVTNEPLIDFIGFADAIATAGSTVVATIGAVVTGLSGLTPGVNYYLQNSAGTIGTSANGNYSKIVGKALTATTLLIAPQKTFRSGLITKVAAYTYTAECDGFIVATQAGGTLVITANGVSDSAITSATGSLVSIPTRTPVARGSTYSFTQTSGSAGNIGFIPTA